ncbi:hypothetical protein [Marinicauda sp. Alg238-R41]|jgi:hypothetical protein|uniref:hypothetical protein n=1 Tax=Marinicauda sp. Alg238-R41 TaxID=2993447 RepID=UPI0022E140CC|nr:hypothetical protein [Marinicauda sp. Alg238-R41]
MTESQSRVDRTYLEDIDAVLVTIEGRREPGDIDVVWPPIIEKLKKHGTHRMILDVRSAHYEFDLTTAIDVFVRVATPLTGLALAIVIRPDQREVGIVMKTATRAFWNEAALHTSIEEAVDWLDS